VTDVDAVVVRTYSDTSYSAVVDALEGAGMRVISAKTGYKILVDHPDLEEVRDVAEPLGARVSWSVVA